MPIQVKATTADAYKLIHDGALALARAEREGIRVDIEYCEKKKKHLTKKIKHYHSKLKGTKFYTKWESIYGGKTNIYSNYQLSRLLYHIMKIEPPKTTASGQGSTDDDALNQINMPELKIILKIRKLTKVRDTYLHAFVREQYNGYIHPTFHLHTVRTFRSSSSDPNFQNIPKRDKESMQICRRALLPHPGAMLAEADFSAIEVMISACYHRDPVMLKYLKDKNSDMHANMAKQIFMLDDLDRSQPAHSTLRTAAKNGFVFPQFYGDYYLNNAMSLAEWVKLPQAAWGENKGLVLPNGQYISDHFRGNGIKSFQQFVKYVEKVEDDFWNNRFKIYNSWRKAWVKQYRKQGSLKMFTGFTCSGVMRENEIINYPIQGSAFHCLLFTFIELDRIMMQEKWRTKLLGQIHDSIVMNIYPEEFDHVKQTIFNIVNKILPSAWDWITVPLEIDLEVYGIDKPWIAA